MGIGKGRKPQMITKLLQTICDPPPAPTKLLQCDAEEVQNNKVYYVIFTGKRLLGLQYEAPANEKIDAPACTGGASYSP